MKPLADEAVERELVERQSDERGVADPVAETRAGDPRGPIHVEAADVRVLLRLGECWRVSDAAQLLGVVLGRRRPAPSRAGGFGTSARRVSIGLGRGELGLERLLLLLHRSAALRAAPASACP